MKYYSEKLGKLFDTSAELEEKEALYVKEQTTKAATKSKLAKEVSEAQEALDAAYDAFELAKKEVAELQKEYDKKVDEILDPVVENVRKCNERKAKAIKQFNDAYGPYTTTYTGDRALKEWAKTTRVFEQMVKNLFR